MAVPALLLAAIGIAAGTGTGIAAGAIRATPTQQERDRARRLEAAEKKLAAGQIGFTPSQREELASLGQSVVAGAEREYLAREGELAALQGITGGALLQQQLKRQEQIEKQRAQVSRDVRQAELAKRQQDLAEIEMLRQQVAQDQLRKKGEAAAVVEDIGAGISDFATFAMMMEQKYSPRPFADSVAPSQAQQGPLKFPVSAFEGPLSDEEIAKINRVYDEFNRG